MINSYVRVVTDLAFADEPVTLADANAQSRLTLVTSPPTVGIEDDYVESLIPAARHAVEGKIGKAIGEQTFEMGLGQWPFGSFGFEWQWDVGSLLGFSYRDRQYGDDGHAGPWGVRLEMPRPPLIGIDSIKYAKLDGTEVTWYDSIASPAVDPGTLVIETGSLPGAIFLKSGQTWPTDLLQTGYPIKIQFRAGISPVPPDLQLAIKKTIAHFFENREPVLTGLRAQAIEIPMSVAYLLEPFTDRDFR